MLLRISDSPVVALNHAVAVAMVAAGRGPASTCSPRWRQTGGSPRTTGGTRSRAHLLEMAGDVAAAREAYLAAAERTTSLPRKRYLYGRAARLPVGG